MGGPRKAKFVFQATTLQLICLVMLNSVTELLMLLDSWSFHLVVYFILRICLFFRELITPTVDAAWTVDGYLRRIWLRYYFSFIHAFFSTYLPIQLICQCSLVYELQERTNNCLSRLCSLHQTIRNAGQNHLIFEIFGSSSYFSRGSDWLRISPCYNFSLLRPVHYRPSPGWVNHTNIVILIIPITRECAILT